MRLLFLFLLSYFVFRYARYLFKKFSANQTPDGPSTTINNNPNAGNTNTSEKQIEGEYVPFEEIKDKE